MFDHVRIEVSDLQASAGFYDEALRPLGLARAMELPGTIAFGRADAEGATSYFLISERGRPAVRGGHIAFAAQDTEAVDDFYAAALSAGGSDNGAPGLRTDYHPGYYGAFVLDPDGNNIEAVVHLAADAAG